MPSGDPFAASLGRILLVEDEMLVRAILADQLRDVGYVIVEACDADEALAVLRSGVRFDLIISDVRMPGSLDGLGLLSMVRATFPTLPVIITSGHLEPRLARADGAADFLAKPYPLAVALTMIEDVLARAK
jgi:CheY-like chemotaxis protein